MTILETIFNGIILRCDCGREYHVSFADLGRSRCVCGIPSTKARGLMRRSKQVRNQPEHVAS